MIDKKKIANNILDFLIDPTRIPVQERVYFRPEEILRNETYEKAKADACIAYKDQKHNADFYPQRNRSLSQEVNTMDRKALIASLDVLSKNFKNDKDPFAVDLRTMAMALSKMADEDLLPRLASDSPELESVLAGKTFKCPECGTNVLEQTGYCVKCKKKVKKAEEEVKAEESVEALLTTPGQRDIGIREPGSSALPGGGKIKSIYEKNKVDIEKTPWLKDLFQGLMGKKAFEETLDFWTKEASDAVAEALLSEVVTADDGKDDTEIQDTTEEKDTQKEQSKDAAKECPVKKDVQEEPKDAAKECPVKKDVQEEQPKNAAEECPIKKEESKEAVSEEVANPVDTDILASINFAGIDVPMSSIDEIGELSTEEKNNLAKLF
jgi:predicted RNA-binding Zn-ribbon protein involved in translation (DUF1610 family)